MLQLFIRKIFGSPNDRYIKKMEKIIAQIAQQEALLQPLDDEAFPGLTAELKQRYQNGESLDVLLPQAFAYVREASKRTLGLRHYDVQMMGGIALHRGHIAQMGTGEGKTLVATLSAYLNSLTGDSVHIVTVNDYLAERDAEWMGPIYAFLGLECAYVTAQSSAVDRQKAYASNVVYVTNTEIAFDFLRDNMVGRLEDQVQGAHRYVIVDEVDSALIDNARTPVVISGNVAHDAKLYSMMAQVAQAMRPVVDDGEGDFKLDEQHKQAFLTDAGHEHAEQQLIHAQLMAADTSIYDSVNIHLLHYLMAALKAQHILQKDVDYVLADGHVVIVDEHSGRAMPGRRWGDGVHQAVEAKEGLDIQQESQTLASITFQNFFRQYEKIAGMTGTAETEAQEFQEVYGLSVVAIPSNKQVVRADHADVVFLNQEKKYEAIIASIVSAHEKGQPVLVGTVSIENSERIGAMLAEKGVDHHVLNAKYHEQEAHIIANAGRKNAVTIATNMAGRGTDIVLGGDIDSRLLSAETPEEEAAIREAWLQESQEVKSLGGLKIIGTERHESRRIDNQLRGRSGRQGDPGETQFYLSLEDNLMRIFASDKVREMMQRLGMRAEDTISAPMLNRAIENAQRKVEGHNYDVRKQLLQFDDIANDQRKVIFSQRHELLGLDDIQDVLVDMQQSVVAETLDMYAPQTALIEEWDIDGLHMALTQEFGLALPLADWMASDDSMHRDLLEQRVLEALQANHVQKETLVGADKLRNFEKMLMLQVLDIQWKEHLATMDHLRHGIHLRGYAQRNPVQEYKRESFEIFTDMLKRVKFETVKRCCRAQVSEPENKAPYDAIIQASKPIATEPRRNDLCPCESGLKYKHCCGKITVS